MGTARRQLVTPACLSLGMTLVLCAGARWYLVRETARRSLEELAICQSMAAEIESFRAAPQTAVLQRQSDQQILLSVQHAAQGAEIPDRDILRITPQAGRRRSKASHVEQPTTVELRQVTLGQLSRFLQELSALELGLQPTSIRLTAPRLPVAGIKNEVWACEFILTYLVFSPE